MSSPGDTNLPLHQKESDPGAPPPAGSLQAHHALALADKVPTDTPSAAATIIAVTTASVASPSSPASATATATVTSRAAQPSAPPAPSTTSTPSPSPLAAAAPVAEPSLSSASTISPEEQPPATPAPVDASEMKSPTPSTIPAGGDSVNAVSNRPPTAGSLHPSKQQHQQQSASPSSPALAAHVHHSDNHQQPYSPYQQQPQNQTPPPPLPAIRTNTAAPGPLPQQAYHPAMSSSYPPPQQHSAAPPHVGQLLPPGPLYPTHPQPHLPAPRFGPDRNGSPEQLAAAAGASQQQQAREQGGAPLSASPYGAPGGIAVIPGISRDVLRAEHESVLLHHQQWQEAAPYWRPTTQSCAVYNMDRSKSYMLRLNPRVERGFFVADGDWTCYRRNYFQVSMGFSAIDHVGQRVELPCIVAVDGRFQTVTAFHVGITARTSNGQRQVELVQHTAKRDKGPQLVPESRLCQPQDSPNGYGLGSGAPVDTFHTVTFDRLQFKAATANNGKRRAAQQYHVLVAELYAEFSDKGRCRIAFTESAPLVVRGRAPGHYALMHHKTGSGGHASNDYPMSPGMDHAAGNTSSGDHQIPMTPPPPRGMVTGDESHSMHSRHTGLPPPSVLAGYPMHQAHHPQPHQQQSVYSPHPSSAGLAGSDPQQQYYQPQQQQGLPPLQQQQQPQLPPQQQQQQYPLYTPQHTAPHLSHRPPGPGDSHHAAHHHGGGAYGVDNRSAPGQPGTIQHRPLPHHLQQQERSSHHHSQHQQQQQYRDPGPYETAHQPQHQHPSQYSQHHQPHYPHQAYSQHQHPSEQGLEELGQYSSQHQQQQQPLQAQRPPSPQSGSAASASHHAHPSPAYPASNSVAAAGMSIPAAAAPVGREQDERQIQPQQQPLYRSRSPTPSGIPLHSYNTTEQQQQRQSQSSSQGLPHRHHHHQPHHHSSGGRSHGSEQDVQSSPQQQQQQQQQQQGPASSSAKPGSVAATRGRENGHQHDGSSNNVADHTHSDNKASNNTVAAQ